MSRKVTVEEAQKRLNENGFELVDPVEYQNAQSRCKIRCFCGKTFRGRISQVLYDRKSCGHCNDPNIGDRFGSLTVKETIKSNKGCSVICVCDCGNVWGPRMANVVVSGGVKTCGHCKDPVIGDRFGNLTITQVIPSIRGVGCNVICVCDCGATCGPYNAGKMRVGNTNSCGHCDDPKVGDRFNSLSVIEVIPSFANGCSVICKCDCGNITECLISAYVKTGHTKSCGRCKNPNIGDVNGKLTVVMILMEGSRGGYVVCECECGSDKLMECNRFSSGHTTSCGQCGSNRSKIVEHELSPIISEVLGKDKDIIVEADIPGWSRGVDLMVDDICIEFDGWWCHRGIQDATDREERKTQAILDAGYKLLRIRSSGSVKNDYALPSPAMLRCAFESLEEIDSYEIILGSWIMEDVDGDTNFSITPDVVDVSA